MSQINKCAKPGCERWAYLKQDSEHYCDDHRRDENKGGGFVNVFAVIFLTALGSFALVHLGGRSIPVQTRDDKLCWVIDTAYPWEEQSSDLFACVPISIHPRSELFPRR